MDIRSIQSPFAVQPNQGVKTKNALEVQGDFKSKLNEALNNVNKLQSESAIATEKLAKGEIDNLHDVMIIGQKASIALTATVEVRNKVIEAYQEVMRMQV